MAAIVNDRSARLQAESPRFFVPADRALLLAATANVVKIPISGAPDPSTITFAATLLNMPGTATFSTSPTTPLTVSGNTATLNTVSMVATSVQVTATFIKDGVTYSASQTVTKVADGSSGIDGVAGLSNAQVAAYKRAPAAPSDNPGDVTYSFGPGQITVPATDALANGWTKTIPAGTDPLYITVASASSSTATDTIAAAEWSAPLKYAQNGLNVATVYLYQRAASNVAPALPSATTTYTFSTHSVTGVNNGWSSTVPVSGGSYLFVTTATASAYADTDTISASEWAAAQLLAQNGTDGSNGSNGSNGQRGTVTLVAAGFNSWSSAGATNAVSSAGYGAPQNRDTVTLTNNSSYSETRFWDSVNGWMTMSAYIPGNMVVSGTLSCSTLAADTLTGQTYRTAASGQRVTINEAGNNELKVYDSTGTMTVEIGGTSGRIYVPVGPSISPSVYARTQTNGDFVPAVCGSADTGGVGVNGNSTSGYGGEFYSQSGVGLYTHTTGGTGAALQVNSSGGNAITISGGSNGIVQTGGGVNWLFNVVPATSNTYSLGNSSQLWSQIWCANSTINTSDPRTKTDVQDAGLGLAFVQALRPVKYRQKVAENVVTFETVELEPAREFTDDFGDLVQMPAVTEQAKHVEPREGVRFHYGFLSTEVRAALSACGVDDAALWVLTDKDDPDSLQALRYEQFVPILARAVQELTGQNAALEAKLAGAVQELAAQLEGLRGQLQAKA